jgi:hypothetical protein
MWGTGGANGGIGQQNGQGNGSNGIDFSFVLNSGYAGKTNSWNLASNNNGNNATEEKKKLFSSPKDTFGGGGTLPSPVDPICGRLFDWDW